MLKRKIQVLVRMNEAEYFKLRNLAHQAGNSTTAFVRRCCLGNEKVVVIDNELVRDIYREMNAIGRNINQIARIANTNKSITSKAFGAVEGWLYELWRVIDEKIGGLKR